MHNLERPILVTGGAGFIGSNFIMSWFSQERSPVINLDKLTYAGNLGNLSSVRDDPRHLFVKGDICDADLLGSLFEQYRPQAVVHFAAESHVDRSIVDPSGFVATNVLGTCTLLQVATKFWSQLTGAEAERFRFLHVSTDEVFGSLEVQDKRFSEATAYDPKSPYSASKASSDHLVRAWHHTYGLPTLITNCSNNYGPFQFPEKLIPLVVHNALNKLPLPIYGDGRQIRDWLYVNDHCTAISTVLHKGIVGETYCIGGSNEKTNLDVVFGICKLLDKKAPLPGGRGYKDLVVFVRDRPGHDRRYAIDASKIEDQLGWRPAETFETGLAKTIDWYLSNQDWTSNVTSGAYRDWVKLQYLEEGQRRA